MHRTTLLSRVASCSVVALVVALVAALTACGSDATAPQTLSEQDAQQVGAAIDLELEQAPTHMTFGTLMAPPVVSRRGGTGVSAASVKRAARSLLGRDVAFEASECPSFSPTPIVDTDEDGVPDNELLTFAPEVCTVQFETGTLVIGGSVTVLDPAPSTAGLAIDVTTPGITIGFTDGQNHSASITQTGHSFGAADGGGLVQSEQTNLTVSQTGQHDVVVANQFQATFVPQEGQIISQEGLPNGTFDFSGGMHINDGVHDLTLVLATTTPLVYDATCAGNAESSFTSGVVQAAVGGSGPTGYLQLTFTDCQAPAVIFVSTP